MDARTVSFGVLGPLQVIDEERHLQLGGRRQRALLAFLLLRANELVRSQDLADALFGSESGENAIAAVYVAVSRLRRALDRAGLKLLHTRPGGYTLSIVPEQIDAVRFEQMIKEARGLRADGQTALAVALLRDALSLWRGPALADLTEFEFLAADIRRLHELQTLALAERIDAELELGRGAELVPELERLVAADPLQERLRSQLMLALYRSGRQADALASYREASHTLRERLGVVPGPELRELEHLILRQHGALRGTESDPRVAQTAGPAPCPFKGLAYFDRDDAEYFFGRERLVAELVARLAEWTLVGVLGSSGVGKSSLLRAGLLSALASGALPGSSSWRQIVLRPGSSPERALSDATARAGIELGQMRPSHGHVLIAVDQMEELFTLCADEHERASFLARLATAAMDPERRTHVVCALRADFYGRLGSYPEFAELLNRSHVLVGPMDRAELAAVIERPAARAGLTVERELVESLVADVTDSPGGLPLLSTALLELWHARSGPTLEFARYHAQGGLHAAVSRLAESAYAQLSEEQRAVAKTLLVRLAREEDGALVRGRVPLDQLEAINGGAQVLRRLTDSRLLTVSNEAVELSHEALLREWPRYRAWLEEDRVGRRLRTHLTQASGEWATRGHDAGELYRGARLSAALEWAAEHDDQLGHLERQFLDRSRIAAESDARRRQAQNRRLTRLLAGTFALLILAILAGAVAVEKQQDARRDARLATAEARTALGRQLAAEAGSQPQLDIAMLLSREAVRLDRSVQTEGALLSSLLRSPAVIGSFDLPVDAMPRLALSPDGRTLVVSDSNLGQLRLYDTRTHALLSELSDYAGRDAPAYSPDGHLLVYPDGAYLHIRNARTLALVVKLALDPRYAAGTTAHPPTPSLIVAPGSHTVYSAYSLQGARAGNAAGGYVEAWSLPNGRPLFARRVSGQQVLSLASADHGARLLVVSTEGMSEYSLPVLHRISFVAFPVGLRSPKTATVAPDGDRVAIATRAGAIGFISARTGRLLTAPRATAGATDKLLFTPTGAKAIGLSSRGSITAVNSVSGHVDAVLSGPLGQVQDAAVSPDGQTLYSASLDGGLLAWDLSGQRTFGRRLALRSASGCCDLLSPRPPVMAASSGDDRLAVGSSASVDVLSTSAPRTTTLIPDVSQGTPTALALSPTGTLLAVGQQSGLVQIWSLNGRRRLVASLADLRSPTAAPEPVQSLAFSPDGRLLSASALSQAPSRVSQVGLPTATLALWSLQSGFSVLALRDLGPGNGLGGSDAIAFSRNGRLLAVSLLHGGTLVLDAETGALRRRLLDPREDVISLAFGTNNSLATGTLAGTITLWNAASGVRLTPPVPAALAPVSSLAFDNSGEQLASAAYGDGTIKLWRIPELQQEGPSLSTDPDTAATVAFQAPQNAMLAAWPFPDARAETLVADDRENVLSWPVSVQDWERRACAVAGRELTPSEWQRFVPGLPYQNVCP